MLCLNGIEKSNLKTVNSKQKLKLFMSIIIIMSMFLETISACIYFEILTGKMRN